MKKLQANLVQQGRMYWSLILMISIAFIFALASHAQDVVRQGTMFIEQADTVREIKTDYVYIDRNGDKHEVYLSKKGCAYIYVKSKKGKIYKKYLPKVTEILGTKKD